jgi:hypothetical protein
VVTTIRGNNECGYQFCITEGGLCYVLLRSSTFTEYLWLDNIAIDVSGLEDQDHVGLLNITFAVIEDKKRERILDVVLSKRRTAFLIFDSVENRNFVRIFNSHPGVVNETPAEGEPKAENVRYVDKKDILKDGDEIVQIGQYLMEDSS